MVTIPTPSEIAHYWDGISFFPDRQAGHSINDLKHRLEKFRERARALAAMDGVAEGFDPDAEYERFAEKHLALFRDYWAGLGRCISPVIVGRSRFPVDRSRKAHEAASNKYAKIEEHLERAIKSMERRAFPYGLPGDPVRQGDPDAIEKLKERLQQEIEAHERGKAANRAWKKKGAEGLREIGWPEDDIAFCVKWKHQPYFTANGSARIRRLKERIAQLEAERARGSSEWDVTGLDLRVVENAEIGRIQIVFDGKPDADTRSILKRNGFRWSPRQGAWQRHLNNAGRQAVHRVLEAIHNRS